MRPLPLGLGVWCFAGALFAAEPAAPAVKLVQVKKIWDQAPHNAFTDLIRFQDKWYCTFREGTTHVAGAGTIRVLVSADGDRWESAALLEKDNVDLRDPKLSLTPDGSLLLVGGAAEPASRNPVTDHYSFVSRSKDGRRWEAPRRVGESWQWLWRVTWHKGTAYGVAYQWNPKAPNDDKQYSAVLYKSRDGNAFEKVTDFKIPNATEAALAFEGDTLYCLQRRDGKPNTAMLGTSQPPYTEWDWKDLGAYLGGPQLVRGPDGRWWACGRMRQENQPRTVLCALNVREGKLKPVLTLPSGGDTSYPGLVWYHNELWISYYSTHENNKTSIFLARVQPASP